VTVVSESRAIVVEAEERSTLVREERVVKV
jgi:hypothetical protein